MAGYLANLQGKVTDKSGNQVDVESLKGEGKYIGIYFSAHWCPPCRGFTPVLTDFYNEIKASDKADKFEIIFVSSDRSEADCMSYYNEMPWCLVSFKEQEAIAKVKQEAGVSGIPCFLILNGEGKEHIKNARGQVTQGPATFLWK